MQINIQDAKTQLSRLIDAALAGEEIIIARAGEPCVRLVSVVEASRAPGAAKGKARLTDAFFEPLPDDMLGAWNGQ
ncbi:MAG TPA: type II toxin-antitoxin system prevent-host-death family antitoxin [Casimicrobium sp.]|jgi:prevent-host-death family protein|nr:type II toxin-antitoxin system prevent-host-death family antitoxin [Casimicrobium sp.]HPT57978.1 type II toxin-antitoxin system prevent-host-death family antitoxin [Casimicrobium sp.]